MLIKMLKNSLGAEDGYTVKEYLEGNEYNISDNLAKSFIAKGKAKLAEEKKVIVPSENKSKKTKKGAK